jgi:hypothetical protein
MHDADQQSSCHATIANLLDQETLDLVLSHSQHLFNRRCNQQTHLDGNDLRVELPGLVGSHASGDDGPRDTASTAESSLGGNEDVRHVLEQELVTRVYESKNRELTLSSQRRGKWRTISMGSTSAVMMMNSQIPRLRVLVASLALLQTISIAQNAQTRESSPLLQLLVVRRLLDKIEDLQAKLATQQGSQRARTHLVGQRGVGERESLGVGSRHFRY